MMQDVTTSALHHHLSVFGLTTSEAARQGAGASWWRCSSDAINQRHAANSCFAVGLSDASHHATTSIETDRYSVSVSVTAPKLAIFLVSCSTISATFGYGRTSTRSRREPKLSLLAKSLVPPLLCCWCLHLVGQKDSWTRAVWRCERLQLGTMDKPTSVN